MSVIGWGLLAAGIYIATTIKPRDKKDKNFNLNNGFDCLMFVLAIVMMLIGSFK